MTTFFSRWIFAPFAVCLFVLTPTRIMRVAVVDGPETRYSGFPLPWRADLHISSGASEVYIGPLLIDLAAYALLALALLHIWRRIPAFGGRVLNTVGGALIWLSGIGLFALIAWIMSVLDTFYEPWYDHQIWGRVISSTWGAGV